MIERYEVSTDTRSSIENEPKTNSDEPEDVVDLIKRVLRVSCERRRLGGRTLAMRIEEDPVYDCLE